MRLSLTSAPPVSPAPSPSVSTTQPPTPMQVDPDSAFYADATGFNSNLDDGTLSVTVLNGDGSTYRSAQTTSLKEQGESSGCYRAVIPGVPRGFFLLKWDDGAGGVAYEPIYSNEYVQAQGNEAV